MQYKNNFNKIKHFCQKAQLRLRKILVVTFLSLGTSLADGFAISLAIPVLKGILGGDFLDSPVPFYNSIIKQLYDFLRWSDEKFLLGLGIIVFLSALLRQFLEYYSKITICSIARTSIHNIRCLIFEKYLSFGKTFFDRSHFGHLQTILVEFPDKIAQLVTRLRALTTRITVLFIYCIMMFLISYHLTILMVITFSLIYFVVQRIIRNLESYSSLHVEAKKDLSRKIFNSLTCIPLIKLYATEKTELNNFIACSHSISSLEFQIDKRQQLIGPLQKMIMVTIISFILTIVVVFMKKGMIDISEVIVYFYLIGHVTNNIDIILDFKAELAGVISHMEEILKTLNHKESFVTGNNKIFRGLQNTIQISNLHFSYHPERLILKNISFTLNKNEMTAIVGPSGSGKTTLIHLLLRYYNCPKNSIYIDGVDITEFKIHTLMEKMAFVSQDDFLFHDTLKSNILYGLKEEVSQEKLTDVLKKARLSEFVKDLPKGMNTIIGDQGVKLSGGEKQRIAIARALLKEAEILILDEATSSLDSKSEQLIQEALSVLLHDKTSIIIAHRLSTIRNAHKIVVIDNGEFIEEGSFDELIKKKGKFYKYWQEQQFA